MALLLLLLAALVTTTTGQICAGCPMEQDTNPTFTALGKMTFAKLQQKNQNSILGHFAAVANVKTQVVAGTFFTFALKSTLGETVEVKLFRSLPDNGTPRHFTYEVSFAEKVKSTIQNVQSSSGGSVDLVVSPDTGMEAQVTSLETRGVSWTETITEQDN